MISDIATRPLGFNEILSISYNLFTKKFRDIMTIYGMLLLPVYVLTEIFSPFIEKYFKNFKDTPEISTFIIIMVCAFCLFILIASCVTAIAQNACVKLFDESFFGREVDWKSSIKLSLVRFWPVALTSFILLLLILPATCFLIIPGIILATYTILSTICTVLKNVSGMSAIKESIKLVSGKAWLAFRLILIFFCMQLIISFTGKFIAELMPKQGLLADLPSIISLIFGIISSFLSLYNATTFYIFYINREMLVNSNQYQFNDEPAVEVAAIAE